MRPEFRERLIEALDALPPGTSNQEIATVIVAGIEIGIENAISQEPFFGERINGRTLTTEERLQKELKTLREMAGLVIADCEAVGVEPIHMGRLRELVQEKRHG